MSSSEHLDKLREDLGTVVENMEAVRQEIITETKTRLARVAKEVLRDAVLAKADVAEAMGADRLRTLKDEAERIAKEGEAVIEKSLSGKYMWSHLADDPAFQGALLIPAYYDNKQGGGAEMSEIMPAIRAALGPLGELLAASGLATRRDVVDESRPGKVSLGGGLSNDPANSSAVGRYAQLHRQLCALTKNIAEEERRIARKRVADLFDNA